MILAAMLTLPLVMHNDTSAFAKWGQAQKHHAADIRGQNNFVRRWESVVENMRSDNRMTEIQSINTYANHALRYGDDIDVWKVDDYWASPGESLAKGFGDCEDYAILKYYSLLQLGFDKDDLKLLVAVDKTELHTVLIVDDKYLLDNETDEVKQIKDVDYYTPIYMINSSHYWYKQ